MIEFKVNYPGYNAYATSSDNTSTGWIEVAGSGQPGGEVNIYNKAGVKIAGPFEVKHTGAWRGNILIDESMIIPLEPSLDPNPDRIAGKVYIMAIQRPGPPPPPVLYAEYEVIFHTTG
ncbi:MULTISPECIES: hypothetical protein [Pseudomonas]|uniref:Uncharacterized protein n=1 Tax=Pseudomonas fluorescens ICMP 11288 TaxID=1198309 RepID=A0A0W0HJM1_PSEFL|nr:MULTISPECIES: hypothetical protein [Pseudomonas]KTB61117.1 hypothetical protein AO063_25520 [Pseudomonas fluorescens ICMP 11288]